MTDGKAAYRRKRLVHSGVALLFLIASLAGCSSARAPAKDTAAYEHAVLDRLLALPLEELATALGNASIWRAG
jgi:hypothetical protein